MKRIPLKTVLYQISLDLDPNLWNESTVLEHSLKAARKMGSIHLYSDKLEYYTFDNYKFTYPKNMKYLGQVFIYNSSINKPTATNQILLDELQRLTLAPHPEYFITHAPSTTRSRNKWALVYDNPGVMTPCMNIGSCFLQMKNHQEYAELNVCSGLVMLSYKEYAVNTDGEYMIPDNENYKEALTHYVMYKYYDGKIKADASQENTRERSWHLQRYAILSAKAVAEVNEPTENQLESIRKNQNKLLGGLNMAERGFIQFGTPVINN